MSKIEWTDETWNPVTGCDRVSPGCANCYAERMAKRLRGRAGYPADDPFRVTVHEERLAQPFHWKKPRMIFVNSMSDLFHDDIPVSTIAKILVVMERVPQHTYQVLTKRPDRVLDVVNCLIPDNMWLGVSCENQEWADRRIPTLLKITAATRFVSLEPLLGPIYLEPWLKDLDWVIVGGESGPGARYLEPWWVRSLRDQCLGASTPFFFKQWGGVHKKRTGRVLDGRVWDEMPTRPTDR